MANTDVTWNILMASITVGTIPTIILAIPVWRFMVRVDEWGGAEMTVE